MARLGRRLLAPFWITAGTLHFLRPRAYEAIMPEWIPAHRELVLASGAAEIAGGAGLLYEPTRRMAGWWLLLLLVAVYPANVHMALNPDRFHRIPAWALWARLPVQFLFAWWVWRVALRAQR